MKADRLSRFGDWTSLTPLCQIGRFADSRPFYAGTEANERMDLVRKAINDIRVNWDRYPEFMRELREFMEHLSPRQDDASDQREKLELLLYSVKHWVDSPDSQRLAAVADYSAIQLYASQYGYNAMFGAINSAFRSHTLIDDYHSLRCGTFLIELLTIDLYNFSRSRPAVQNFEGHVYRGMCVSAETLEMFRQAARGPISERYLSIPLAMASASRNRAQALAFALEQTARAPDRWPLLWDITVFNLDPELLSRYRERFPASIVTSLCAVPIESLSDYPEEEEILLRGPHFQIIRLYRDSEAGLPGLNVIEAVMLNSNRDHITAIASNTGDDRAARDMFRAVVTICRSSLCADRAGAAGLPADAESYLGLAAKAWPAV